MSGRGRAKQSTRLRGISDIDAREESKLLLNQFEERYSSFWDSDWTQDALARVGIRLERPKPGFFLPAVQRGTAETVARWMDKRKPHRVSVRKALELVDGKVTQIVDDGRSLPRRDAMVVFTNTTTIVDHRGHHARTLVMVLDSGS